MAARAVMRDGKASGQGVADARLRQDIQETFDRQLPTWLRGSRLLDNNGAGYAISSAAVLLIPHLLGRAHRGYLLVGNARSAGAPVIAEARSDHASYNAALASTHLQLLSSSANESTIKVVVW